MNASRHITRWLGRWCLLLVMAAGLATATAQNFPFPQHVTYATGTIKPAFPQATLDAAVTNFYQAWKARYLVTGCQSNHAYVHYSVDFTPDPATALTCSEAHGYGMLITALMAGHDPAARTNFDGMYRYFTNHFSSITPYLMSWQQVTGCVPTPDGGSDSATDGDLDMAYALLLADRQWGSEGGINYLGEARKMIAAILQGEINTNVWSVKLGDWADAGDAKYYYGTRPSDFMMDHFRAFQTFSGNTNWSRVVDKCYTVIGQLQTNYSVTTGLLPDFATNLNASAGPANKNYLEGNDDGYYAYNACRTPWRIGTDYLVSGDPRARVALQKINAWIQGATGTNPANINAGYKLDGTKLGTDTSLAFTAPFAVGAMASVSNQVWLDRLWTNVVNKGINDDAYFGNSIKMLNLLVLSGNWWVPSLRPTVLTNGTRLTNGHFRLEIQGEPQFTNRLEASTNLKEWMPLLTTNLPAGKVQFQDTQAVQFPQRFYRSK